MTGMNTRIVPATTPGIESGRVTRQKGLERVRAQVGRGFVERGVDLFKRSVDRQDHERQEFIDHPHQHGSGRIQHLQWLERDMQKVCNASPSTILITPCLAQQHHPGIDADDKIGPQRDQHQEQIGIPSSGLGAGNKIRQRIGQQDDDDRGVEGQRERAPQDLDVKWIETGCSAVRRNLCCSPISRV